MDVITFIGVRKMLEELPCEAPKWAFFASEVTNNKYDDTPNAIIIT